MMLRMIPCVFLVTLALLSTALPAWADDSPFESRLQAAIAAGEVDADRADLYRLFRVRAPERLPEVLRAEAAPVGPARAGQLRQAERPERDATGLMRLLRIRLADAPAPIRAEAEPYLFAVPTPTAGREAVRVAGKTGGRVLRNRVTTENFSVEWGSTLTNEDGTSPAVDGGPAFPNDPAVGGNGVPDVVERWAAYLEASFGVVLGELGFPAEALSTYLVPVFLGNSDPNTTIDNISTTDFFGFTEFPTWSQVPYLVVNNNFKDLLGVPSPAAAQPFLKVTAAHEFFHVLHFLYESPAAASVWQEEFWWWEASATWMEDEVFDSLDDYQNWLRSPGGWADFVEQGLAPHFLDPHYAPRAYGAVIFAKYLSEHVGGRDSMRQVWNRIRPGGTNVDGMRVLDALDDYTISQGFESLEHLYPGFAGANAVMDYEEGGDYGQVPVRSTMLTASSLADNLPVPEYLGATYLSRPSGNNQGLRVSLAGLPATTWGLAGVVERNAGFSLTVADSDVSGTPAVHLADLAPGETAFAVPSLLNDDAPASYASTGAVFLSPDGTPPGAVAVDPPTAQAGGFDLTWAPVGEPDVAGYVVRWRPSGMGSYVASRTLFGAVAAVEVRGLDSGTYDVQVFAYDQVGNADSSAAPVGVTVDTAGSDAPVPLSGATIPNLLIVTLELGAASDGGGGGGGGGCFLRNLGY